MIREHLNLLPPERLRAFRREYFIRVLSAALFLFSGVVVIHAVLLFPSYIERVSQVDAVTALTHTPDREGEAVQEDVVERLALLKERADYALYVRDVTPAHAHIERILTVPRNGISLSGLSYIPVLPDAKSASLVVQGIADSRESLRGYERALAALPGVVEVELPLGAYATETAITFSIRLSWNTP